MKKVLSMLLVCVMLVGALAGLNVFAAGEASIEIVSHNVNIGETINLMYAVETENADDLDITVEVTVDGDTYTCEEKADATYGTVYVAPKGVAPYDIAKEYTAVAKLSSGATSDPDVYSVLEYLNERKYVSVNNPNPEKVPTAEQLALYDSLLDYAEKLAVVIDDVDYTRDAYSYVIVDGTPVGLKENGSSYTPVSTKVPAANEYVNWTITDANGNPVGSATTDEEMQENGYTLNAPVVIFTSYVEEVDDPNAEPTWNLVTNAATLAAGDQIVIVAKNANNAMSTTQNTNNRASAAVTKDGDTVTFGADVQIITLEAGTSAGSFAFQTGSGYLYAASTGSNHLKTKADKDANGSWTIAISNGVATIQSVGNTTRGWIRYNSSNNPPLFSCYGSGQTDVVIYKLG